MIIKIHEHAAKRYVLTCYLSQGRPSLNWEWRDKIKEIEGEWLEVETDYLFSGQFNTVPIPGISDKGLRIMNPLVVEIENDARLAPVHEFVEGVLLDNSGLVRELVEAKWNNPQDVNFLDKWSWVNIWKLAATQSYDLSHDDIDLADRVIHGKQHKCTPIEPLVSLANGNVYKQFYFGQLSYRFDEMKILGVLD